MTSQGKRFDGQNADATKLRAAFAKRIGMALPEQLLAGVPLCDTLGNGMLLASASSVDRLYLQQGFIKTFFANAPVGYRCIGFWGHGINTHAFYWCARDEDRSVFLRLAIGGAYMDNAAQARGIRAFLPAFLDFADTVRQRGGQLTVVDSMGTERYVVTYPGVQPREVQLSMVCRPDAASIWSDLALIESDASRQSRYETMAAHRQQALQIADAMYTEEAKRAAQYTSRMRGLGRAKQALQAEVAYGAPVDFRRRLHLRLSGLASGASSADTPDPEAQAAVKTLVDTLVERWRAAGKPPAP